MYVLCIYAYTYIHVYYIHVYIMYTTLVTCKHDVGRAWSRLDLYNLARADRLGLLGNDMLCKMYWLEQASHSQRCHLVMSPVFSSYIAASQLESVWQLGLLYWYKLNFELGHLPLHTMYVISTYSSSPNTATHVAYL